jgi:hypothetical protein
MSSITVYGASDDTIVIDGAIEEEFDATSLKGPALLAFSDGTVLSIEFTDEGDDGTWRIRPIAVPDADLLTITLVPANDPDHYSDRAELRSDCDWVVYGSAIAQNKY